MNQEDRIAKLDEKTVDALFAPVDQCQLPGVAVAVAIAGVPVYRKGFGLANMELPVLLSPSMRMRIGSTTKHFTALAFLLLVEEGRAGLDDPIGKYVPAMHGASRNATMRQLMGHTSGIRDAMAISMTMHGSGRPLTDKDLIGFYETIDDVDFAPETSWSYNNGGYILLTAAIERITGETLDAVLRKRIFEPVGMADTMLRRSDNDFVPNSATLHFFTADGRYTRDYMGMEITGAGGMVSTMDDMLRWLKHMDAPVVGSAETWHLLRAPHRLANGTSTGYGFGLITSPYRGVETLSHGGGVMAGNSQMIKVPSAQLDISIAANRADVSAADLANKIIDACVAGLAPERDPKEGERRSGTFVARQDWRVVELVAKDEMQLMTVDGGPAIPLVPDGAGGLELPAVVSFLNQSLAFEGDAIRFTEFGNADLFDAVDRVADARLGDHAGLYAAETIAVTAELDESEEGVLLRIGGRHGTADYRLEPITDMVWKARFLGVFHGLGGIVSFDADGGGFAFTAGRMKAIRFVRRR